VVNGEGFRGEDGKVDIRKGGEGEEKWVQNSRGRKMSEHTKGKNC